MSIINYYGACFVGTKYRVCRFSKTGKRYPTDSMEFDNFEDCDKAAKWFADNYKNGIYLNMR